MGSIQVDTTLTTTPFQNDTLLQVRTGRIRPTFGHSEPSGIFKTPRTKPIHLSTLGLEGDERAYEFHKGPDNALMHYPSQHYALWKLEHPENAHLFTVGAFGENLVTEKACEDNICIGDVFRIGKEALIQVSMPRQPCYKLNHRFEIKDMSLRSQTLNRTGWYYRMLKQGWLAAGDEIVLVERKHPKWTIVNVQHFLYKDIKNQQAIEELAELPELAIEIRTILKNRLKKKFLDESRRLEGGKEMALTWSKYRLAEKRRETPRISSFVFEAVDPSQDPKIVEPGSHIRVKLGSSGKLVRAYSVINGNKNRFTLGVALEEASRGGSKYLHENVEVGGLVTFGEIKSDFPLSLAADRHIFIAGGIGITAFIASARKLQEQREDFHLYYAVRCSEDIAFVRHVEPLGPNISILDGSEGQRLDLSRIIQKADDQTHIYVCGPDRLMSAVTSVAGDLNFPQANIHFEAFTAATSGDPFEVELDESDKFLEVKEEQTLLDVLRDAGFEIPSSCEVGNCGTCRVGVKSGRVDHRGTGLMADEKRSAMLSCVSRGIGKVILDL